MCLIRSGFNKIFLEGQATARQANHLSSIEQVTLLLFQSDP